VISSLMVRDVMEPVEITSIGVGFCVSNPSDSDVDADLSCNGS